MGGDGVFVAPASYNITEVVAHESAIFVACAGSACSGIRTGDFVSAGLSASEPLPGSAKVPFSLEMLTVYRKMIGLWESVCCKMFSAQ